MVLKQGRGTKHCAADNPLFTSPPALSDQVNASAYIEKFNVQLCDSIYTSLDQPCGKAPLDRQDFMKDFWTDEMNKVFDPKERYYQKWRKASGLNCLRFWLLHQQTRAQLRRPIHQRRRALWR
ncbi:hypothetical protein BD560DRAFT_491862 [Blakeslea trispora]|nr:hypothetical protein BD560DRAFT_491862 [Blakeslea trispora]